MVELTAINRDTDLISITEEILLDTKTNISQYNKISVPITQLSALGAGVASMLPTFRTITQTTAGGDTLYRIANKAVGDIPKLAKDGNIWGAMKTASGSSKMAKFQQVGSVNMVMPLNPATMMMAVALCSIEKQLGEIAAMQKQILSFLEVEKESEIEADIETLSNILEKYKHNWDNEQFISSNHKLAVDIQRTARKHINSFQKRVKEAISAKQLLVMQSKVHSTLDTLQKDFKYYRLSLFTFSMSSLVEIMLSGNFKEENIEGIKNEIEKLAFAYRDIHGECSAYLEKTEKNSVEQYLLKGVSATSKAMGKFIGNIPKVKDGQLDELLLDSGAKVDHRAKVTMEKVLESFAKMSNPGVSIFIDKMEDLIQIYNHTTDICFDNDNIYLITA